MCIVLFIERERSHDILNVHHSNILYEHIPCFLVLEIIQCDTVLCVYTAGINLKLFLSHVHCALWNDASPLCNY
jgi:hypothetical protein